MSQNPQPKVNRAVLEQTQDLLAALQAAYLTYRTAHWQSKGDAYYGDHLMLQRIYEESAKHVDSVAERMVGYFGAESVDLVDQVDSISYYVDLFGRKRAPIQASLAATEVVRELLTETYAALEKHHNLTLGMDDLLMATASEKDVHQYLLQQALSGREASRAPAAQNPGVRGLRRRLMT